MSLKPIEPTVSTPGRARRVAVTTAAVIALLIAVTLVMRSDKDPDRGRVETGAGEDQNGATPPTTQRRGRPKTQESSSFEQPDPEVSPRPTTPAPATNPFAAPHRTPATARPISGIAVVARNTATGRTTPGAATTVTPAPDTPAPEVPGPGSPPEPPPPPPPPAPEPEPPVREPEPTEQERCITLGGVAIGDNTDGDPIAVAARDRFRAAAAQIPDAEGFQCGSKPVARFLDDLIIQRIQVAGRGHGILVGGTKESDPVLWLSEVEWTSYKRMEPWDATHNFTGVPVERTTIGGHQMIRTSRGAVVMVRSDSWGHVVVSGAWDVWMASGGPNGPMGLPEGLAIKDPEGAHQDFTNGVLKLPGVTSKAEAEAMPASRYVWVPLTVEQRATPPPAVNSIQDVYGVSYYVDRAGVRHWLETASDWSCARSDLGATEVKWHVVGQQKPIPLPGWQAARAPLGPVFVCPAKPPA